jgi:hypothetical protein
MPRLPGQGWHGIRGCRSAHRAASLPPDPRLDGNNPARAGSWGQVTSSVSGAMRKYTANSPAVSHIIG